MLILFGQTISKNEALQLGHSTMTVGFIKNISRRNITLSIHTPQIKRSSEKM